LIIDEFKIWIKAEIGNILRGSGISNQVAGHYLNSKAISNPNKEALNKL